MFLPKNFTSDLVVNSMVHLTGKGDHDAGTKGRYNFTGITKTGKECYFGIPRNGQDRKLGRLVKIS